MVREGRCSPGISTGELRRSSDLYSLLVPWHPSVGDLVGDSSSRISYIAGRVGELSARLVDSGGVCALCVGGGSSANSVRSRLRLRGGSAARRWRSVCVVLLSMTCCSGPLGGSAKFCMAVSFWLGVRFASRKMAKHSPAVVVSRHCCIQRSAHPRWRHLPVLKPYSNLKNLSRLSKGPVPPALLFWGGGDDTFHLNATVPSVAAARGNVFAVKPAYR